MMLVVGLVRCLQESHAFAYMPYQAVRTYLSVLLREGSLQMAQWYDTTIDQPLFAAFTEDR